MSAVASDLAGARLTAPDTGPRKTPPVSWFALIGAIVLVFQTYVIVKWVTGPRFERVPYGPSEPPDWMKVVLITWQALGIPLMLMCLWTLLIRPWRRNGRPTFDGLAIVAYFLVWFQDPLSNYFGQWLSYNAYLVNFGSWVNDVPGYLPYGEPGRMLVEPILWTGPVYLYVFYLASIIGCWAMRTAHRRWPNLNSMGLIGICWVAAMIFDVIIEGFVIMPLGFYEYQGGHLMIFPDSYHAFPLHEAPIAGAIFAGFGVLRYFRDDKGHTLPERGVEKLQIPVWRKDLYRFLAIFGMVNVMYLLCYNLPNAFIGANAARWPDDLTSRSYFLNGMCGAPSDAAPEKIGRACPGNGTPLVRGNDTPYLGTDGKIHVPKNGQPPEPTVPLKDGKDPPFSGPILRIFGSQ